MIPDPSRWLSWGLTHTAGPPKPPKGVRTVLSESEAADRAKVESALGRALTEQEWAAWWLPFCRTFGPLGEVEIVTNEEAPPPPRQLRLLEPDRGA